ncbi:hypothetical protein AMTR_s00070p00149390 [Amborella trichopoda]|uniref:Uncharacterized protein n=1 Tax=Amborella trichopoda TaxID=13333 RepID=U5DDM1_AMBTC|nr:hypothetical protein AMTR_s00070p00149390 [Amborella trichopoda]
MAPDTSLLEQTAGKHIFQCQSAFLDCRSAVGQTNDYRSTHWYCRRAHSECRSTVLHCRSAVATEASLQDRTAGAQFSVCQSAADQTKHCRSTHCYCWRVHSNCQSALLHCRNGVALDASLQERVVALPERVIGTWGRHQCQSVHCDCPSECLYFRSAILHCRSIVAPEASLSERTTGACSFTAGACYHNAGVLWVCQSTAEVYIGTAGASVFTARESVFIVGA